MLLADPRLVGSERKIVNVTIGQLLNIPETEYLDEFRANRTVIKKYVVTEVYPYHVRARRYNEKGGLEHACFSLGELVQYGYEPKGGVLE